jgi:putative RNA 2'-phosphotransferase
MDRAHVSKTLSWLLRHGAAEAGLHLDAAGWAPLADVLRITGVSRGDVEAAVRDNTKRRFELDGDRIRAVQGHSSTQVDLDALEASWERVVGRAASDADPLYLKQLWHCLARFGRAPHAAPA